MTEDGFVRVCAEDELPLDEPVRAEIDGTPVAVVKTNEGVFAIYDECSHAAVALSEGDVDDCTLECWLHGSRFDLRTGKPTGLPATVPVEVYPVEIRDGDVYLGFASKTLNTDREIFFNEHSFHSRPACVGQRR